MQHEMKMALGNFGAPALQKRDEKKTSQPRTRTKDKYENKALRERQLTVGLVQPLEEL